ncbi:3721_t:CDS:2 [Ambispora leptoticha]|uniref:3721_t:CDS:1 n=1 Tax=Ambispora leptoticha TaxID=144679 RepID=A0A9N8WC66_9GLOM|nr:3721_t:CDS:2 [Ambispora leptoticha]
MVDPNTKPSNPAIQEIKENSDNVKKNLKPVETKEKIVLPTASDIEQEKKETADETK